jgi:hypothetical protein
MPVDTSHPRGHPLLRACSHLVRERGEVRDRFVLTVATGRPLRPVASRLDTITAVDVAKPRETNGLG